VVRILVLVGIAAVSASAAARPRTGKVVRIERASRALSGVPRMCQLQADPLNQVAGQCYGPAPSAGDTVTVLDAQHVIATVRLASVAPMPDVSCADSGFWMVTGSPISGQTTFSMSSAVIDVPLDPRSARVGREDRSPSGRQAGVDNVTLAVDSNGDGVPDYDLVTFTCDDSDTPTTGGQSMCLEWYASSGHGFDRVRLDRVRICP